MTAPSDRIEIRLPSRADWLGAVRSVVHGLVQECLEVRLPEATVQEIQLCLQEAAINVCRHAHAGRPDLPLVIGVRPFADRLEITVEDEGPGLPAVDERPADPDPEAPREGGYGLFIMRETMDEVRSERRDGRHVLTLVKRFGDAPRRNEGGA